MTGELLHIIRQQHQEDDGSYTVLCVCEKSFTRPTRHQAIEAHAGHFGAQSARAELEKGAHHGGQ